MFEYTESIRCGRNLCWHADLAEIFTTRRFEWPPSCGRLWPELRFLIWEISLFGLRFEGEIWSTVSPHNCRDSLRDHQTRQTETTEIQSDDHSISILYFVRILKGTKFVSPCYGAVHLVTTTFVYPK